MVRSGRGLGVSYFIGCDGACVSRVVWSHIPIFDLCRGFLCDVVSFFGLLFMRGVRLYS